MITSEFEYWAKLYVIENATFSIRKIILDENEKSLHLTLTCGNVDYFFDMSKMSGEIECTLYSHTLYENFDSDFECFIRKSKLKRLLCY